ncbi:MAG: hypothetical protein JWM12_1083 [Ilumatobacteraceae bacterium]|jgi:hypothetical protein|nr:hypothetical protein [Ilumatobacteraceae bacterium]
MAKQIITTVTDDIDGSPEAENITFGFQGVAYSIDLGPKNAEKLQKALKPYIDHATRQRGASGRPAPKRNTTRDYDLVQLREWAAKEKVALPQRGRIPAAIVARYQAVTK